MSSSTVSLGRQSGWELTGPGRKAWITPPGGGALRAELHSNGALDWGDLHIPLGRPPSRVVRTEEALGLFRAEKGALQDLVTSSCTSGKNGTGGGCRRSACAPRNQSSSLERSGEGGGLQCSPTLSAARESIAVSSGSYSGIATLPDGGSAAESSSPEPSSSPDAVIDILSSAGAPNEMLGPALSEDSTSSSGNPRRCDALEEWEARGDALNGEALNVILKSPWPWAEVALREPGELERGMARGIPPPPPRLTRRYLEHSIAMVMFPHREHESSTSAASASWKPKHETQRSWPSDEVRKRPHPETPPSLVELF